MNLISTETQGESKTKTAGIPVTPSEKAAIEGLARLRMISESDLLRTMLLGDIVVEFERIQGMMDYTPPATGG